MYDTAGPLVLWTAPAWTRHIIEALMLPACIFVAAAYLPGNLKLALADLRADPFAVVPVVLLQSALRQALWSWPPTARLQPHRRGWWHG
jgi:hypothetical protein